MLVKIYTLGCKVNTYESNVMMESMKRKGYQEGDTNTDVVIINTCSVTNTASKKSVKMIHQAIRKNPNAVIVVCGCMSQVETDTIKEIDGVSIILGNLGKSQIPEYVETFLKTKKQIIDIRNLEHTSFECMKLDNFNRTRAFIKIQDGCENFCSYCIIPYTRGNVRSKDKEEILEEARHFIQKGHHEIVLTGIHTGHYGSDLKDCNFATLLRELITLEGLERLRISSIEMNEITEEVLELFQNHSILVDHMHIPLQSGCDKILKLMNRKYDLNEFENKLNEIRKIRPLMSITTDVIVGFPNETEEDFQKTIETVQKFQFSKIHVFPYSRRQGTKADSMEGQVPEEIKRERSKRLIQVSKVLEQKYMEQFLNKELSMIPEVMKDGYLIGHTGNYLLVKVKGTQEQLHQTQTIIITKMAYPYVEAELKETVMN
ncbi:MAG: tRNA (N(6)-L-threonylcarbamoyladenosine(37)-C(2))-methylthiotransferase MtaB [Firmicutes bacterium]|nr:tRNA (N(6)-L-threonylcarbamoyladenosine(37)-C(2))-methylthiotransferase MtaB [Bacillota bacterium]